MALSHRRMPFSFFVTYVPYDVTFTPPTHPPNKKAALMSTFTVTSSHGKFQKKEKKKIKEPPHWPGGAPPLSPKAEAFLLFRVWLETFLPASSKSNNKPLVPWECRGGLSPGGEVHTSRSMHKRPASGGRKYTEEWQRKRTKSLHLKGVFSLATRVLALWEQWRVKQKSKMQRGKKKSAMSFIRLGGLGNVFKNFRPTSKKQLFPTNIKGPQPTARFRHKFCRDSLLIYTHKVSLLFCLHYTTDYIFLSKKNLNKSRCTRRSTLG